jgi:hypothetical protein
MWKPSIFTVENVIMEELFPGLIGKFKFGSALCLIGNVYGLKLEAEKVVFFTRFGDTLNNCNCRCALGGDFNSTLNLGERRGNSDVVDRGFHSFVVNTNIIDLPIQDTQFTWYSIRNGGVCSRLDRWLLSEDSINLFDGVRQSVEDWGLSNHFPVIQILRAINFGPKPFLLYRLKITFPPLSFRNVQFWTFDIFLSEVGP